MTVDPRVAVVDAVLRERMRYDGFLAQRVVRALDEYAARTPFGGRIPPVSLQDVVDDDLDEAIRRVAARRASFDTNQPTAPPRRIPPPERDDPLGLFS